MVENSSGGKRRLRGKVISNKMDKTVVVAVERKFIHPKYGKYITSIKKYAAHDENNACALHADVLIEESRPLSKTKRWVVVSEASAADSN
jgi:small subunit ribosomal protein S17